MAIKNIVSTFVLCCLVLLGCNAKQPNINALKALSDLATLEYTLTKVVKLVDEKFYGDRKILFQVDAKVKAGIDLSKVQTRVSGKTVYVNVPSAKIIVLNILPESIKEVHTSESGLRFKFSKEEKLRILEQGEKDIQKKVQEIGLLKQAKHRAHGVIRSWLYSAGFTDIQIKEDDNVKSNTKS